MAPLDSILTVLVVPLLAAAAAAARTAARKVSGWSQLGPARAPRVTSVVFDPTARGIVYAALERGGVTRSEDGGATWQAPSPGLFSPGELEHDPAVRQLVISPTGRLVAVADAGIHESVDRARSWSAWDLPIPLRSAPAGSAAVAFDSHDPESVYLAGYGGIFHSSDHGATWLRLGAADLPDATAVAVDRESRHRLHAGFGRGPAGSGLYASEDGGATWVRAATLVPFAIVQSAADPRVLWAAHRLAVIATRDHGGHWSEVFDAGTRHPALTSLLADAVDPATAYLGGSSGAPGMGGSALWKTGDGGAHWTALTHGLPAPLMVTAIAQDPFDAAALLAATDSGAFRSGDRGTTWTAASAGIVDTDVTSIAAAPDGTLYATAEGSLWRSDRHGRAWTAVFTPAPNPDAVFPVALGPVAVDPAEPRTIYLGNQDPSTTADVQALWKSTDGGASWQGILGGMQLGAYLLATDLLVDPAARTLYLSVLTGTDEGPGAWRSSDGGATWTPLPIVHVHELALDPAADPPALYAANGSIHKSTDRGATWTKVLDGGGASALIHIAIGAGKPSVIYALSSQDRAAIVYRSVDGGATWTMTASAGQLDVPRLPTYHSLAVDPRDPQVLYAGWTRGVARSIDGGAWTFLGRGLVSSTVTTLALAPGALLAGTAGAGIFARPLASLDSASSQRSN